MNCAYLEGKCIVGPHNDAVQPSVLRERISLEEEMEAAWSILTSPGYESDEEEEELER